MTFDLGTVPGKILADEPSAWVWQGQGDDILVVFADGRINDEPIVFAILLAGQPMSFMPVVVGPEALLDELYTEIAIERPPHLFDWSHAEGSELVAVPTFGTWGWGSTNSPSMPMTWTSLTASICSRSGSAVTARLCRSLASAAVS